MDSLAGIVALAVLVVWLAYFVPSRLRHRTQVASARTDDRFSQRLRVLSVSGGASVDKAPGSDCASVAGGGRPLLTPPHGVTARPASALAGPRRRKGARDVERSGISAARRDHLARRRAAAQRRSLLTVSLATLSVLTLVLGLTTPMPAGFALIPTVLLVSVLALGRRAVLTAQRADAELARRERTAHRAEESARSSARRSGGRLVGRPAPVVKPHVTGRGAANAAVPVVSAAHEAKAEPLAVAATAAAATQAAVAAAAEERVAKRIAAQRERIETGEVASVATPAVSTWSDAGVPRPSYAMKPAAARWEPAPLSAEIERVSRRLERWDQEDEALRDALDERDGEVAGARSDGLWGVVDIAEADGGIAVEADLDKQIPTRDRTGGLGGGLDGILERRRAAGE